MQAPEFILTHVEWLCFSDRCCLCLHVYIGKCRRTNLTPYHTCSFTLTLCSAACASSCWLCTFCKRMLPGAWHIQGGLFSGLWPLRASPCITKIKSCRREKTVCLEGWQEHGDWTYTDSCKNKGFRHQHVCSKEPSPSVTVPLKMPCWNPSESVGFGVHRPPSACAALQETFSAPNANISVCWASQWRECRLALTVVCVCVCVCNITVVSDYMLKWMILFGIK